MLRPFHPPTSHDWNASMWPIAAAPPPSLSSFFRLLFSALFWLAPKDSQNSEPSLVQFVVCSFSIILQNDNCPCPLIAISYVLLLRNNLNLSLDLLSLVAERLIDSNSNVEDKDARYVQNQQQNISDAIDMLPRLATGIDVNLHFRKIDSFEFTPECAIFDLLGIELYHGWIVDT